MRRSLFIFCGWWLILVSGSSAETPNPRSDVLVEKIFDDGRYNCFTDLVQFKDAYYCTFRSAISHGDPSSQVIGKIVVIRSTDLKKWDEVARVEIDGVDLRDPKLTVSPTDLRVYAVAGEISDAGVLQYRAVTWKSTDGQIWSKPKEFCPGYIFWRPKWHAGKIYVPAYLRRPGYCSVDLLVSDDGENWQLHSTPVPPVEFEEELLWANECDLLFLPEGKSMLFARRNLGDGKTNPKNAKLGGFRLGSVSLSDGPKMSSWKVVDESLYFHAPATLAHRGKIYLAGRDMVKLPDGATETCKLWEYDRVKGFTEIAHFPTRGDCSYPGIAVVNQQELAISYYSCHEGVTAYFDQPGKSDIYLARVRLKD